MPPRSRPQHLHPYDTSGGNLNKCFPSVARSLALLASLSFSPPLAVPCLRFQNPFAFRLHPSVPLELILTSSVLLLPLPPLSLSLPPRCCLTHCSLFTQSAVCKNVAPSLPSSLCRLLRILPNIYLYAVLLNSGKRGGGGRGQAEMKGYRGRVRTWERESMMSSSPRVTSIIIH